MEHADDPIRPWRRATIAVTVVASVELIVIAAIGIAVLGNPLAGHLRETATAATPRKRTAAPAPTNKPILERNEISVMVLNGNGVAGAAHAAAEKVRARDYLIGNVGNAEATSPRSLVMYRAGYAAEGARLARDLRVRVVRPLDGMRPAQLMGSHLVLILGR
jgi:LytR cell envelope-related transcriptional attenuator